MKRVQMIIGIYMMAQVTALKVNVPSDGTSIHLVPETGDRLIENFWELRACEGCKMVLSCDFAAYYCRKAKIIIDNGEEITEHCPEYLEYVSLNSWKNNMTVTILNNGRKVGADCKVAATGRYIDIVEKEIDSSEHGLAKTKNKRCGWSNKSSARIVGGKEAGINEYPFIVSLMTAYSRSPFCGGSIITKYHVLTAAHCTEPMKRQKLSVAVGEHDMRTWEETTATRIHNVERTIEHNLYDDNSNDYDIALAMLETPIEFNDFVGPVCMPIRQQNIVDAYIKVIGWGLTTDSSEGGQASPILRKVNLRVINANICKTIYEIDDIQNKICTYSNNKDSCEGDSGGPLIKVNPETNMYQQVALVSYGMKCASTDPAVNTDVAFFLQWIKRQIKRSKNPETLYY